MSSARTKKPLKVRAPAIAPETDLFRSRKEENFPLHDEADLVNFRADALNRYITNQELLDNVVLRLLHASRIVPPRSFPGGNNSGASAEIYPKNATDSELLSVVQNLKVDELFSGDLRLMKAKQQVLARDLAALNSESVGVDVLDEETRFQKQALDALAAAYTRCGDPETVLDLEAVLNRTLNEYKMRFKRDYVCDDRQPQKHAIHVRDLAPDLVVSEAPANYNPRLINTYIDMKGKAGGAGTTGTTGTNIGPGAETSMPMGASNSGEADFTGSGEYMEPAGENYDDFGMLSDGEGHNREAMSYDPQLGQTQASNSGLSKSGEQEAAVSAVSAGAGVDMDEIDQFLADPDAGDGMDGMLMDFEHENEDEPVMQFEQHASNDEHAEMDDDPFNVDFLSLMGNGLE